MSYKLKKNNQGSALIVATISGVVIMTFSLMLLMVAYSLFATANEQQYDMSAKELSQSIAEELTSEMLDNVNFPDYESQYAGYIAGSNSMWFYLRCNLFHPEYWPAINQKKGEVSNLKDPYKYFKLDTDGSVDDVTVKVYWEKPSIVGQDGVETLLEGKEGTRVHFLVSVTDKDVTYESEKCFVLSANMSDYVAAEEEKQKAENPPDIDTPDYLDPEEQEPGDQWEINKDEEDKEDEGPKIDLNEMVSLDNSQGLNPNNYEFLKYEKWSWSLE